MSGHLTSPKHPRETHSRKYDTYYSNSMARESECYLGTRFTIYRVQITNLGADFCYEVASRPSSSPVPAVITSIRDVIDGPAATESETDWIPQSVLACSVQIHFRLISALQAYWRGKKTGIFPRTFSFYPDEDRSSFWIWFLSTFLPLVVSKKLRKTLNNSQDCKAKKKKNMK